MPTPADRAILDAFAAWERAYDRWEESNRLAAQALANGASSEDVKAKMRQAEAAMNEARRLFDDYLKLSGGRIDTGPSPLA